MSLVAFDFDNTITESTIVGDEVVFNMGDASRVAMLRTLFMDLHKSGVILIVVSLNFRKTIQDVLAEYGLLDFFFKIYDRNNVWKENVGTKQKFMEFLMAHNELNPALCVLVDDQASNLINAPCNVVQIEEVGGINMTHDHQIRKIFQLPVFAEKKITIQV